MRLLNWLDQWFGRFAVPQITLGLIILQVFVYLAYLLPGETGEIGDRRILEVLELVPQKVLAGEVWRIFSFVIVPPIQNPLFMFFAWYLFYLMGTSLENHWGTFRYNLYLLTGWAATVAVAFLYPGAGAMVGFLAGSVFLAFAHLNPTFPLYLFFILQVEIRWLALLTWIIYGAMFLFGDWATRLTILAAVMNYLLFFGAEIVTGAFDAHRRMSKLAGGEQAPTPPVPVKQERRCEVCGLTTSLDPSMEFRYCSKCSGMRCYCTRHIREHEHVTEE